MSPRLLNLLAGLQDDSGPDDPADDHDEGDPEPDDPTDDHVELSRNLLQSYGPAA